MSSHKRNFIGHNNNVPYFPSISSHTLYIYIYTKIKNEAIEKPKQLSQTRDPKRALAGIKEWERAIGVHWWSRTVNTV